MDRAEDQISLPEQVKYSAKNPGPLPGEGGEEEGWPWKESCSKSHLLSTSKVNCSMIVCLLAHYVPIRKCSYLCVHICFCCRAWQHKMRSCWRSRELRGGVKKRPCSGTKKRSRTFSASSKLEHTLVEVVEVEQSGFHHYIILTQCFSCVFYQSKMLELFSSRLDVMHGHQASSEQSSIHSYLCLYNHWPLCIYYCDVVLHSIAGATDGQTGNRESPRNADAVTTGAAGSQRGKWKLRERSTTTVYGGLELVSMRFYCSHRWP